MPKALKGSTFYSSSPFYSFPYTVFKFSCSQDIWRCFPWPAMTHSSASPSRPGVTTLLSELTVMPDCCGFLARLDIFGWLESGIRTRESATLSILYICSRFFCNISSVYSWSVYVFLLPLWFPIFLLFLVVWTSTTSLRSRPVRVFFPFSLAPRLGFPFLLNHVRKHMHPLLCFLLDLALGHCTLCWSNFMQHFRSPFLSGFDTPIICIFF